MPSTDAAPPPVDPAGERKLTQALLERFLCERRGFAFALAVADDQRAIAALYAELHPKLAARGCELIAVDLGQAAAAPGGDAPVLLTLLRERLAAAAADCRQALWLTGLGAHLDYRHGGSRAGPSDLLATANFQRDLFPETCPVPVVLWASSLAVPVLPQLAPDLWSWRKASFDFSEPEQPWRERLATLVPPRAQVWQRFPAPEAKRRRALLEALLAEPDDELAAAAPHLYAERRVNQLRELVAVLDQLGAWDEAEARAKQAIDWAGRAGNPLQRAHTWNDYADILTARGQFDEALRIRREEELPVYEQLGDLRSKAVTMGQIADVAQARGQWDEALRIRREEELPVYEQLGDVRERAVTMGKIADILAARGQLDEALRIRREEELPVYQQLGEVREKAVTMSKIADILAARGQSDEALRIIREEALPVYQQLGAVRDALIARGSIAILLLERGRREDRPEAARLLGQALTDARRLGLPEATEIAAAFQAYGLEPPDPAAESQLPATG
ncbi:MAG: hypothetical protein GC191_05500 [Azospirillum sp.]|nr:hypothetical protein [Azospirillum sp.]